jgi:hypothetical protein
MIHFANELVKQSHEMMRRATPRRAVLIGLFSLVVAGGCDGGAPDDSLAREKVARTSAGLTLLLFNQQTADLSRIGTADFDIVMGVQTFDGTDTLALMGQRSGCGRGMFWDIRLQSGIVLVETDDGTNYTPIRSTSGIADGGPHQVEVVRDDGVLSLYIDGKTAASSQLPAANFGILPPTSTGVYGCVNIDGTARFLSAGTLSLPTVDEDLAFSTNLSGDGDFTYSFSITTSQNTGVVGVGGGRAACRGGNFWDVRLIDGDVNVETDDQNNNYDDLKSTVGVADGLPHTVMLQRSSGTLTIFIDGNASGSGPSTAQFGPLGWDTGVYGCVNLDGTVALSGTLTNVSTHVVDGTNTGFRTDTAAY